jgi:hypothetical protein
VCAKLVAPVDGFSANGELCLEPRPSVFVGTLNRRTHEKTTEFIKRNAAGFGLLIVSSYPNCQGFKIQTTGWTAIEFQSGS